MPVQRIRPEWYPLATQIRKEFGMARRPLCRAILAFAVLCGPLLASDAPSIQLRRWTHRAGGQQTTLGAQLRVGDAAKILREQLLARAGQRNVVSQQASKASGGTRVIDLRPRRAGTGTPLQLDGNATERRTIAPLAMGAKSIDVVRDFLRRNAGALRISDPDRELVLDREEGDELGRRHLRFSQQYHGTLVWPSNLIVHLDPAGNVDLVDGAFVGTPHRILREPIVDAPGATQRAARAVGVDRIFCGVPMLIVYTDHGRYPRLAWRIDVSPSPLESWWIVIDAANGTVIDRISRVMSESVTGSGVDPLGITRTLHLWQSGGTFYMLDASKPMFSASSQPPDPNKTSGAIMVFDAQNQPPSSHPQTVGNLALSQSMNPNSWPVADNVAAAYWLSATYDYYLRIFNRNSIDGSGGNIVGVTRFGSGLQNAFWMDKAQTMFFGDADLYTASVDVIGHELTHGVTSKTAALEYKDQAGALNESISDIFGQMVEADAKGSNDWIIGSSLHTPVRNMKNPGQFGDPDRMSQYVNTTDDHGGVHTNNGIVNHAYYLLAEGLDGGIGRNDASAIFYRALTQHLTKDSQFIDARIAAVNSANELFGSGSRQAQMTGKAFDAVEIFDASAPSAPPSIPTVNGPDATLFVFFDPKANASFLARRELASDGDLGIVLSHFAVSEERPGVSGDGSLAVFVDSTDDVCLIPTDGSQAETCLKLPSSGIHVSSVGMSRDANRFGFVLLGSDGNPENSIIVVDLNTSQSTRFTLTSNTQDGGSLNTIQFADTMTFTADGQLIVYDAFNVLTLSDGSKIGAWSIGALDLNSGGSEDLLAPIAGHDIEFPDLGKTSDQLLTFEVRNSDNGETDVLTANLDTQELNVIGKTSGVLSVPTFTGDDLAVVYAVAASTPTKTSLVIQRLGSDHLTTVGTADKWIDDGGAATVYRRGTYAGPTTKPGTLGFASGSYFGAAGATTTVTVKRASGNKGSVSVSYRTVDGTAIAGRDYSAASGTLTWSDGDDAPKTFQVRMLPNAGATNLTLNLSNASGGAQIDQATASLSISSSTAPPTTTRKRSVHH